MRPSACGKHTVNILIVNYKCICALSIYRVIIWWNRSMKMGKNSKNAIRCYRRTLQRELNASYASDLSKNWIYLYYIWTIHVRCVKTNVRVFLVFLKPAFPLLRHLHLCVLYSLLKYYLGQHRSTGNFQNSDEDGTPLPYTFILEWMDPSGTRTVASGPQGHSGHRLKSHAPFCQIHSITLQWPVSSSTMN